MKTSPGGRALIRNFEGLRLDAYDDGTGTLTIGYGHTPATPGQRVTHAEAEALLDADILSAESAVRALITAPLSQSQFDALVSFTYNLGADRLRDSTLRELLNAGDYRGAQSQFRRWIFGNGRAMDGLRRRRAAEAAIFGAEPPPSSAEQAAPAPVRDAIITPVESHTMSPFILPALEAVTKILPELKDILFDKSGTVPERNATAAIKVVEAAKEAVQATNEQQLVEKLSNPAAHAPVRDAVQGIWYELVEAGGGGISGARKFAADHEAGRFGAVVQNVSYAALAFLAFANLAILPPAVYAVIAAKPGADQLLSMAAIVMQADIGAALTSFGFWLGSSVTKTRGAQVQTP